VIAGNGNRIEFRHVRGGVFENVGDYPHRMLRRVNIAARKSRCGIKAKSV
jgi:hypothetical protein